MSNQVQTIAIVQLEALIAAAKLHNRPIEVDWTNRTIRVLSEVKIHPTIKLSSGPMTWQDIIYGVQAE